MCTVHSNLYNCRVHRIVCVKEVPVCIVSRCRILLPHTLNATHSTQHTEFVRVFCASFTFSFHSYFILFIFHRLFGCAFRFERFFVFGFCWFYFVSCSPCQWRNSVRIEKCILFSMFISSFSIQFSKWKSSRISFG